MYIVTQLLSKKEREELQQTFMALDKNADGKLSREELIEGYTTIYGNIERANKEVEIIMDKVDVDHNGFIDYSGTAPFFGSAIGEIRKKNPNRILDSINK